MHYILFYIHTIIYTCCAWQSVYWFWAFSISHFMFGPGFTGTMSNTPILTRKWTQRSMTRGNGTMMSSSQKAGVFTPVWISSMSNRPVFGKSQKSRDLTIAWHWGILWGCSTSGALLSVWQPPPVWDASGQRVRWARGDKSDQLSHQKWVKHG